MSDSKPLSTDEQNVVAAAKHKAFVLYKGEDTPHRSCGIALAETFSLPTTAYQSLRRGGITGRGQCGAIRAGEQVLGELLGDPDPTGSVTDDLRNAIIWYQQQIDERVNKGPSPDFICNNLTRALGDFRGAARHDFCTDLAALVAETTAEAVLRHAPKDTKLSISPLDLATTDPEKPRESTHGDRRRSRRRGVDKNAGSQLLGCHGRWVRAGKPSDGSIHQRIRR